MGFSGISKSLINVSGNFMSVKFSKILKYKVDISENLRPIGLSGFFRF